MTGGEKPGIGVKDGRRMRSLSDALEKTGTKNTYYELNIGMPVIETVE